MQLTLEIPDDVASRLSLESGELQRHALEGWFANEYRRGRLHKPDLRRWLGFQTSDEIDTFLKGHEVWLDYSVEDLDRDRETLRQLGF